MARWYPVFAVSGISLHQPASACISLQSAGISLQSARYRYTGFPLFFRLDARLKVKLKLGVKKS
jgi:hypothetical protein